MTFREVRAVAVGKMQKYKTIVPFLQARGGGGGVWGNWAVQLTNCHVARVGDVERPKFLLRKRVLVEAAAKMK